MSKPVISMPVLGLFRGIVRRYLKRHFHAVRVTGAERFVAAGMQGSPLLIYANHGSWWDPMVAIYLAERLMADRQHYAPMDAMALERYGILKRVGIFPVDMKSARGAVQFMRTGEDIILANGVLWVTPQGQFVDARQRPLEFKPGLAALAVRVAERLGTCTAIPLAIEYPFWDERLPECLLRFGEPVMVVPGETAQGVQTKLKEALKDSMDELKGLAMQRDPSLFGTLASGTVGVGGFYEIGQWIKALVLRRPYQAEHTPPGMSANWEKRKKRDA